jgi:hypothetical protein
MILNTSLVEHQTEYCASAYSFEAPGLAAADLARSDAASSVGVPGPVVANPAGESTSIGVSRPNVAGLLTEGDGASTAAPTPF